MDDGKASILGLNSRSAVVDTPSNQQWHVLVNCSVDEFHGESEDSKLLYAVEDSRVKGSYLITILTPKTELKPDVR